MPQQSTINWDNVVLLKKQEVPGSYWFAGLPHTEDTCSPLWCRWWIQSPPVGSRFHLTYPAHEKVFNFVAQQKRLAREVDLRWEQRPLWWYSILGSLLWKQSLKELKWYVRNSYKESLTESLWTCLMIPWLVSQATRTNSYQNVSTCEIQKGQAANLNVWFVSLFSLSEGPFAVRCLDAGSFALLQGLEPTYHCEVATLDVGRRSNSCVGVTGYLQA